MRPLALIAATLMLAATLGLTACERQKGPAERAGEKVDKAIDKVSDKLDPKGPAEKAGRELDRATDH